MFPSSKISRSVFTASLALSLGAAPLFADTTFDFEKGIDGWNVPKGTHWKGASDGNKGSLGALFLAAYKGSGGGKSKSQEIWNSNRVPVTAGEEYDLSVWVRAFGDYGAWTQSAVVRYHDEAGKVLEEVASPGIQPMNYYDLSQSVSKAPEGSVYATLGVRVDFSRATKEMGYLRFDDLAFRPAAKAAADREAAKKAQLASYYEGEPPTPIRYAPEDAGVVTEGELSIGKFYTASRQPDVMYPDSWANQWTLGTRLTDEDTSKPGMDFEKDYFVGWRGAEPVEVTIDLGRVQEVEETVITGLASAEAYFNLPKDITVATSTTGEGDWTAFGSAPNPEPKKEVRYPFEARVKGQPRKARYVKVSMMPTGENPAVSLLLLDGIKVTGKIKNSWREVPLDGAFHGAFPTAVGHTAEERAGRTGLVIDLFEKLVGKQISMVLWYQTMQPGREFAEVQSLRHSISKGTYGHRHLSIGWLPVEKLEPLVTGKYDDYLTRYFTDSIDPAKNEGIDAPIWFRPMNEFNGGWVPYGLEPKTFRAAWRRMYNIAEKIGAAQKHLFVWAPNHRSYPDEEWNKMENYWPGDQYVDWVGLSAYPPSKKFITDTNRQYPVVNVKEFYDKYSGHKPLMIAEGGFSDDIDRVRWVREWFEGLKKERPKIRAVIWENHDQRVISRDPEALKLYRELVQDPYWLDTTWGGKNPNQP